MPDLGALLWPRTVALIGASADAESLRGRIFNVMRSHAFAGQLYPVSRSSAEVLGLKAYASVADLPQPADLAVIIIPAKHVPEELERCGKAGVKSAVVLSSGFAEAVGEEGGEMQAEVRAIAQRYGMAVMGPNSEGFANIAANLCPTFSPAMEAGERPLVPAGRPRPPTGGRRSERRHRLCLLRPRPRQGAVVPLRRHDRQRGLPGGARLRRLHPRRGQDRRAPAAAGGHQERGDIPARGRRHSVTRSCT